MIIFYDKQTGEIYGTIDGRVHTEQQLAGMIKPSNVSEDKIGKYVVSYKPVTKKEKRPIKKTVLNPKNMEINTIEVGEEEVEVPSGLVMDDEFSDFFTKVEQRKTKIHQHRFVIRNNKVVDIKTKSNK